MVIGNVGQNPEMRFTPNGTPTTTFTLATNRSWTSPDGERRQETQWFRVVSWSKLAEFCNQYVTKGQKVYVEGRLRTRDWEGADGQKRTSVEIIANDLQLLSTRQREEGGEEASELLTDIVPEDLPF
ncbi:MAG: single-stranded DNA-binding protein [Chloroflexi bacterium]|nr:single-stranded DNA-binding protein [Chloroflexota bacterium]